MNKMSLREVFENSKKIPISNGGLTLIIEKIILEIECLNLNLKKEICIEIDLYELEEIINSLDCYEECDVHLFQRLKAILKYHKERGMK